MYDIITKLKLIRTLTLIVLLIAAAFISFGEHYIIAIIIMIGGFAYEWLKYRCPHCDKHLDTRMRLDDSTHCPYCGKVIAHVHTGEDEDKR